MLEELGVYLQLVKPCNSHQAAVARLPAAVCKKCLQKASCRRLSWCTAVVHSFLAKSKASWAID